MVIADSVGAVTVVDYADPTKAPGSSVQIISQAGALNDVAVNGDELYFAHNSGLYIFEP